MKKPFDPENPREARIDEFMRTLKKFRKMGQDGLLSEEERFWLGLLDDPEANDEMCARVAKLLDQCRQEWNEETRSFCKVLPGRTARPKLRFRGRNINASRLVFVVSDCWPIDSTTVIRHLCDNPRCLEPNHLLHGDTASNFHDRPD